MKIILATITILLSLTFAFGQTAETCEQAFKAKHYEDAVSKCTTEINFTNVTISLLDLSENEPESKKQKEKLFVLYFARGYSNMFVPRAYGPGEKAKIFAQSVADFEKCNKLVPNQSIVLYMLGFAQSTTLKSEEQIAVANNFSEAIRLNSTQTDIFYLRGKAYENYYSTAKTPAERNKGYELAIADYTKDIQMRPKEMTSVMSRKSLYLEIGKYKEAIDDLTTIINFLPNEIDYPIERGQAYAKWKKYTEAITKFTELLEEIEDEDGDEDLKAEYTKKILGYRADAYKALGKKAEWCKDKKEIESTFDCNKEWTKK